ncbi:MAG TPA: hypothetical protein DD619_03265 [Alphaproteobacteria bacterium]|nr:hypothetical protein [Alphaproteobacteria bacterium]
MKFAKSKELSEFLRKKQIFPQILSIKEIFVGGSSYNFCIKTAHGDFFLKLISAERERGIFLHLKEVLSQLDFLYPLPQEKFAEYYMLAMPYVAGHKLKYKDCTPGLFAKLQAEYAKFQACRMAAEFIRPQQNMPKMIAKISECLQNDGSLAGRLLNKYFWQKIKPELICLESSTKFIHGDLTANNILVDKSGTPYLLDFEQIRYGYGIEDVCYLFLQLSGFRGLWGRIGRFAKLQKMLQLLLQNELSQEYWLYGVQLFYLNHLYRRLINSKKHGSFRKEMCLLWSLRRYFRLSRYLHKV